MDRFVARLMLVVGFAMMLIALFAWLEADWEERALPPHAKLEAHR